MNVLFAGGGTGGHVYPALAVIEKLRREVRDIRIGYVGTDRGLEADVIGREPDIEFFNIEAAGLERSISIQGITKAWKNVKGMAQSLRVIADFNPQLIVGTGGYVSFTPLLWGSILKIPTLIHEQNQIPGLVNRVLAPLVDRVLTSFPQTDLNISDERVVHTGLPLRKSFVSQRESLSQLEAKQGLKLDISKPLVVIMGGTHGARPIHDEIVAHHQQLIEAGVQVVVLAGRDAERLTREIESKEITGLKVLSHTPDVWRWMRAADLMVCRAGAATLAELTAMGVPSIVIPWADAAHNHQQKNAQALASRGACKMMLQSDCESGQLVNEILGLLKDRQQLSALSQHSEEFGNPDATNHVMREVTRHLQHGTPREALPLYRNWRRWNERAGMAPPSTGTFRKRFGL